MASVEPFRIAICGAGLAGLTLALSLHSRNVPCIVYESSERPSTVIKGSINLAPNGEVVLDDIGVLEDILPKTCNYRDVIIRNSQGVPVSKMLVGDKEIFKYDAIRLLRADLIDSLVKAARGKGISILTNKKFHSVVSESEEEVTFKFEDGSTANASMLIGADGIFSRVRAGIHPDITADYIGHIAVMTTIDADKAKLDADEHRGMILGNEIGSMIMGTHNNHPSSWVLALQQVHPDFGRAGWKQFGEDKKAMKEWMRKDYDKWPAYCQRALDHIEDDDLFLWPMYAAPPLPSLTSPGNRVLLIGDAVSSHASCCS